MVAKCLALFLLAAPCAALQVNGKPPKLMEKQDTCALTYAAHSGFGNQLFGALGAGYIAKITGCKLVLPPVLNHGETSYGARSDCKQGLPKEKAFVATVAPYYKKSNLTWTKIYKLNKEIASEEPLKVDPRQLHFLPMHCQLWEEMGQDEAKLGKYLRDFIQKTDPTGSYTIGSGYNTFAPRLDFNELFEGLSPNLEQGVSDAQDTIAKIGKAKKGDYACVHLRSRDILQTHQMEDKPLKEWIGQKMVNVGKKPLLVISANLQKNVRNVMEGVCSKEETECIDGNAVLDSKTMKEDNYGLPDGNRLKSNKRLLIELATCAMASDVYLPNSEKMLIEGKEVDAPQEHIFQSTLSDLILTMAKSEKIKKLFQKEANLKVAKAEESTPKALVFVASEKTNCKCMATQLNESPYPVARLEVVSPATMANECQYNKKGVKTADKVLRAEKCTHYNAYKQAYKNYMFVNNTYSLIFQDETIIKRPEFWQQVDKYLSSPCQSWDFTAVDINKMGEPIQAESLPKDQKICSWGQQSSQEAIYPKVGAGTHLQIIRNSALPRMLKFMEEEEKRDLPMSSVVNHFENVVGWYPEIAAQKGKQSFLEACQTDASAKMAFDCQ